MLLACFILIMKILQINSSAREKQCPYRNNGKKFISFIHLFKWIGVQTLHGVGFFRRIVALGQIALNRMLRCLVNACA